MSNSLDSIGETDAAGAVSSPSLLAVRRLTRPDVDVPRPISTQSDDAHPYTDADADANKTSPLPTPKKSPPRPKRMARIASLANMNNRVRSAPPRKSRDDGRRGPGTRAAVAPKNEAPEQGLAARLAGRRQTGVLSRCITAARARLPRLPCQYGGAAGASITPERPPPIPRRRASVSDRPITVFHEVRKPARHLPTSRVTYGSYPRPLTASTQH